MGVGNRNAAVAQLPIYIAEVSFDGGEHHNQFVGDFLVGISGSEQLQPPSGLLD